jgi:hypothetical protein
MEIGADAHGPQFEHWHVNPAGPDWVPAEQQAMEQAAIDEEMMAWQ